MGDSVENKYKGRPLTGEGGGSEGGGKGPIRIKNGKRNPWVYLNLYPIPMKICRSPTPIPKFAKVHSAPIHKTHGVPIRKSNVTTYRYSSAPNFERAEMFGGDSVAR